jgi:ribose 5-phosphate isomerase
MSIEREKQLAARAAAELVEAGMTVGLGTGVRTEQRAR